MAISCSGPGDVQRGHGITAADRLALESFDGRAAPPSQADSQSADREPRRDRDTRDARGHRARPQDGGIYSPGGSLLPAPLEGRRSLSGRPRQEAGRRRTSMCSILRSRRRARVDAIHPGYGFLSENPEFARPAATRALFSVGHSRNIMRTLGNKIAARNLAVAAGVPVMPRRAAARKPRATTQLAGDIGYPLMLKASWGGGGRGMRVVESDRAGGGAARGTREAQAAFGKDEVLSREARAARRGHRSPDYGRPAGQLVHLFERDCTVQRRNQKVVERRSGGFLDEASRASFATWRFRLAALPAI